jgi:hypothetical protein
MGDPAERIPHIPGSYARQAYKDRQGARWVTCRRAVKSARPRHTYQGWRDRDHTREHAFEMTLNIVGGKYVATSSNEFGRANYEIVPARISRALGCGVTRPISNMSRL